MPSLGKKPATSSPHDLTFAMVTGLVPQAPPADTSNIRLLGAYRMLGNDVAGDCVFAGGCHEHMLWKRLSGTTSRVARDLFTDQTALADYSAVTGYTPADPSTDQGTDVRVAMAYRRRTGLVDVHGVRHKIAAFVSIPHTSTDKIRQGVHLFDAVGIGFQFPRSAMDQFAHGQPWTLVAGSPIDGGHYVPVIGYDTKWLYVVTWGQIQRMAWDFAGHYLDEAWGVLSPEFLISGKSPDGFSLLALKSYLAKLA